METAQQFSVYLENKPGRLARLLAALAAEKVNLIALSVMDHYDQSTLRIVVNHPDRAAQALRNQGFAPVVTDVVLVELPNQPGALARVCEALGAEHINIDYTYCSGAERGKTVAVFKVSNSAKALRVLGKELGGKAGRRDEGRPVRDRRTYRPPRSR